ncbi:hypothetical protein BP5796_12639 [Coleophoma crateriformis]|uniref:Protein kinase domain-containing protein n=1 Tax=Coleophoma crateriformis TaxID=565419 RepID=A0A3D8Q880_9HELO|nr:hypothetical protein BP5796_12639 [Coleophoma crateriformis]
MAARSNSGKELRNILAEKLVNAVYEDKPEQFLPQSLFSKLITKEVIIRELGLEGKTKLGLEEQTDTDLIHWIYKDAPKLFATTVQCLRDPDSVRNAMRQFKEFRPAGDSNSTTRGIDDLTLSSIELFDEKKTVQTCYNSAFKSNWEPFPRAEFFSKRWRCLAEVFKPDQYKYKLSIESILPVVWKNEAKRGGFSQVHRVEIHKDHWKHDCASDMIAIKSISLGNSNEAEGAKAAWEKEAKALKAIKKLNTPHILQCIAAVEQEHRLFFLFRWADGGDLHDYWHERSPHRRQANMVRDVIRQLYGLAEALHMLHNINSTDESRSHDARESIRHGDIKPTNILRFLNGQGTTELGLLKIADMGLAKQHVQYTRERNGITSTNYWTVQYMAPDHMRSQPLSRLYDIWSMGCVILDFVVWILYGNEGLEEFSQAVRTTKDKGGEAPYFSVKQTNNGVKQFEINPNVTIWLDGMLKDDPECAKESAIHDLLCLVKNKLLVVDLPPDHVRDRVGNPSQPKIRNKRDGTHQPVRATARILRDQLSKILDNIEKPQGYENYLLIAPNMDDLKVVWPGKPKDSQGNRVCQNFKKGKDFCLTNTPQAEDRLDFPVDDNFAQCVFDQLPKSLLEPQSEASQLCAKCRHLIFWEGNFHVEYSGAYLKIGADGTAHDDNDLPYCRFCRMILKILEKAKVQDDKFVTFTREMSRLKIEGSLFNEPVVSLILNSMPSTDLIQIGLPRLPAIEKVDEREVLFKIIRSWVNDCDKHNGCRPKYNMRLPTRLIDIGRHEQDKICICVPQKDIPTEAFSYIALSHPWGEGDFDRFTTRNEADLDRFKQGISLDELPCTFRDAVITTRALGKQYLWIDSLCILQDDQADKTREIPLMEYVYSSAYCVIAASRAQDQHTGFLLRRKNRSFIRFPNGVYACEPIDNFRSDVLDGSLSQRAWVLQERALARRTVFFTEVQTYFECGEGIRCETLGKIKHAETAFLGDPNFPSKSLDSTRGERIRDFTTLFAQYSRLGLKYPEDRPNAITGLEARLHRIYDSPKGQYGIFDNGDMKMKGLFLRSLLWRRGEKSWMRLAGGIDYLNPEGNKYVWAVNSINAYWTGDRGVDTSATLSPSQHAAIVSTPYITARPWRIDLARVRGMKHQLIYDVVEDGSQQHGDSMDSAEQQMLEGVVIARPKHQCREDSTYILIVEQQPVHTQAFAHGTKSYRRIGVGSVLSAHTAKVELGPKARIY